MVRYCFINRIGDPHILKVKDFVIFDDAYLTEYDRFLIDENTGEEYEALQYTTIEESVLESPEGSSASVTREVKRDQFSKSACAAPDMVMPTG